MNERPTDIRTNAKIINREARLNSVNRLLFLMTYQNNKRYAEKNNLV